MIEIAAGASNESLTHSDWSVWNRATPVAEMVFESMGFGAVSWWWESEDECYADFNCTSAGSCVGGK